MFNLNTPKQRRKLDAFRVLVLVAIRGGSHTGSCTAKIRVRVIRLYRVAVVANDDAADFFGVESSWPGFVRGGNRVVHP